MWEIYKRNCRNLHRLRKVHEAKHQYKKGKILDNLKKATALYMMQYLPFYVNGAGLQDIYETGYAEMYHSRPLENVSLRVLKPYMLFSNLTG